MYINIIESVYIYTTGKQEKGHHRKDLISMYTVHQPRLGHENL